MATTTRVHPEAPWSQLAIEDALRGATEAAAETTEERAAAGDPREATEAEGALRCLAEGVAAWRLPPEAVGHELDYRAALRYELAGISAPR